MSAIDGRLRALQRHCIDTLELWYGAKPDLGTGFARVVDATVFWWPDLPVLLFNRTLGLGDEEPPADETLEAVVELYRRHALTGYVQLSPLTVRDVLGPRLQARGFTRKGSMATMALVAQEWRRSGAAGTSGISIERVDENNQTAFMRVFLEAFDAAGPFESVLRATMEMPEVYSVLALYEGEPAGVGQIVTVSGVAGLYSGGVLERFRGRGIQSALIDHRIHVAIDQGSTLLYSGTEEPDNQSSRNLRRRGFFRAHELESWQVPES